MERRNESRDGKKLPRVGITTSEKSITANRIGACVISRIESVGWNQKRFQPP